MTYKSRHTHPHTHHHHLKALLTHVLWLKTFLEMLIGKLSHVLVWKCAVLCVMVKTRQQELGGTYRSGIIANMLRPNNHLQYVHFFIRSLLIPCKWFSMSAEKREPQERELQERTSRERCPPHLAAVDEHNQTLSELPRQRLPAPSCSASSGQPTSGFTVGLGAFDSSEIFDRLIKDALLPARC